MKVGIGFAVLNYFEGFAAAIHSIKTEHDYRIYVMDQWRHNRPLAHAWNQLAMQAFDEGCDYALICNDDILFTPETIDKLVETMEDAADDVVMVTPNNIVGQVAYPEDGLTYMVPEDQEVSIADHPNFSCFLIGRRYFETVGFFDENFIPAWYEDNDSHRRAKLLGYREVTTNAAPIVHFGGGATSRMENPSSDHSRNYYISKWGGIPYPESETFEHPYNDKTFSPNQWRRHDGVTIGPLEPLHNKQSKKGKS